MLKELTESLEVTDSDASVQKSETGPLDPTRHGEATREFESFLRRRIVGQDEAVQVVTEMYQMFLVGMNAPDRPVGNLLFLVPTGSGKTYVVEVAASGRPTARVRGGKSPPHTGAERASSLFTACTVQRCLIR